MPNRPKTFTPEWMKKRRNARVREHRQKHDEKRGSAHERGYDKAWESCRAWYLGQPENVFCACGCGKPSQCVDHIEGFDGPSDPKRLDPLNLQAMTLKCNTMKARIYEKDHKIREGLSPEHQGAIKKMLRCAAYRMELMDRRNGVSRLKQNNKKRFVVCGLQGSGKSTWVNENANHGDLIWDMDKIYQALGFERSERPTEMIQTMIGIRQLLEEHLMDNPNRGACIIVHDPQEAELVADRIGGDVVRARVDESVRLSRIQSRDGVSAKHIVSNQIQQNQWQAEADLERNGRY